MAETKQNLISNGFENNLNWRVASQFHLMAVAKKFLIITFKLLSSVTSVLAFRLKCTEDFKILLPPP